MGDATQEYIDRFYWSHGPCCAGCDWWRSINSAIGDCIKSAPVQGARRWDILGLKSITLPLVAGHIATEREHICGDFKDEFDWQSLAPSYLRKIGYSHRPPATGGE